MAADVCLDCGIAAVQESGSRWCEKYKMPVGTPEFAKTECPCFIEFQYEDGELLSPMQHVYLKESEMASRRMRGPV